MAKLSKYSLSEWRERRQPTVAVLPSGLEVQLKRVSLENMAFSGKVPMGLLVDIAQRAKNGQKVEFSIADMLQNIEQYIDMIDALVTAALVFPRIGAVTDDETLLLEELDFNDKLFIFDWALGGVSKLSQFRETVSA